MEPNSDQLLSLEEQHNTKNSESNSFEATLKQYEDILVRLNRVRINLFSGLIYVA